MQASTNSETYDRNFICLKSRNIAVRENGSVDEGKNFLLF